MRIIENDAQREELNLYLDALVKSEGWQVVCEYLQDIANELQEKINEVDINRSRLEENSLKIKRKDCVEMLNLPDKIKKMFTLEAVGEIADSDPYDKVEFGKTDVPR